MWLWRMIEHHGFPKPIKLVPGNSLNFWKLSDLLAWEAQQEAKTKNGARRKPPTRKRRVRP
jgi:predicted DNA-binding transcriptional regulator AlpA